MQVKRVCIVGLGLMGGSLALALRPFLTHLAIVETNPEALEAAAQLADVSTADFTEGVRDVDLVILATPVRTILHLLTQLPAARPDGCLVMDMGSTKAEICRFMEHLPAVFQAIGGHPLCGKEIAGFVAATPDLFRDQTFVLCGNGRTTGHVKQVAVDFINKIGAKPLLMAPETHDHLAAATSHLPYLISAVLMQTVAARPSDHLWQMSASGFRDSTRLAGSDTQMMLDILMTNRTAVIDQIDAYQSELITLKRLLLSGDEKRLTNWLAATQKQYRTYKEAKHID
jgi:prephenate dehydrogenase